MIDFPDIPDLPPGTTVTRLVIEAELGRESKPGIVAGRPLLSLEVPLDIPAEVALGMIREIGLLAAQKSKPRKA